MSSGSTIHSGSGDARDSGQAEHEQGRGDRQPLPAQHDARDHDDQQQRQRKQRGIDLGQQHVGGDGRARPGTRRARMRAGGLAGPPTAAGNRLKSVIAMAIRAPAATPISASRPTTGSWTRPEQEPGPRDQRVRPAPPHVGLDREVEHPRGRAPQQHHSDAADRPARAPGTRRTRAGRGGARPARPRRRGSARGAGRRCDPPGPARGSAVPARRPPGRARP